MKSRRLSATGAIHDHQHQGSLATTDKTVVRHMHRPLELRRLKNEPHSEMTQATCPACCTALEVKSQLSYQRCGACGLLFAWPMEAGSKEWYGESGIYSDQAEPSESAFLTDARHLAFFEGATAPGRLLDLGCGAGTFLRHARSRGFQVAGIEFQSALAMRANEQGLAVDSGDLASTLAKGTEHYDYITAFDVLEHLEDPGQVVELMLARLRSGGVCAVTVPHADRVPASFDPVIDAPPHHLTLWTGAAIRQLFQRQGASSCEVQELPLTTDDLFLHYLWKRYGHGLARTTRRDGLVRRKLAVQVGLRNAFKMSKGHTLLVLAKPPI